MYFLSSDLDAIVENVDDFQGLVIGEPAHGTLLEGVIVLSDAMAYDVGHVLIGQTEALHLRYSLFFVLEHLRRGGKSPGELLSNDWTV